MGRLKKGGVPDQIVAARVVLNDWNCGKIKYYTYPPEKEHCVSNGNEVPMEEAQIVTEFAKEFSLDDFNIVKMESDDMENLPNILPSQTMLLPTSGIVTEHKNEESSDLDTSDIEAPLDKENEKENLLSERISIGANTENLATVKKVGTAPCPPNTYR